MASAALEEMRAALRVDTLTHAITLAAELLAAEDEQLRVAG